MHLPCLRTISLAALGLALLVSGCGGAGNGVGRTTTAVVTTGAGGTAATQVDTSGTGAGQGVSVLGIWSDAELASFRALVAPWGGTMDFTGSRDITSLLTTRVEGGNPPDVAIPAEVGLFQQFANEGKLTPLSACAGLEEYVRANYPKAFVDLGTVNGKLYGFFMKADTKATIFYNPKFFQAHGYTPLTNDSSFDDLIALSDKIASEGTPPWSMGQEAGSGSGFPGSDTIQQILLNQESGRLYDDVVKGSAKFTDAQMKDAWAKFGKMALTPGYAVQGDAAGINRTAFEDATYPLFQSPPASAMTAIGGFATAAIKKRFPNAQPGIDYDFFPWPGGKVTGGANVAYAFNSDPGTCSFLRHIASANAQKIWVQRGGFTSVNRQVSLDAYPDPVARKLADQLTNAGTFKFDLDDAIGGALQQAEFQGVTRYLSDPSALDAILSGIERARGESAGGR